MPDATHRSEPMWLRIRLALVPLHDVRRLVPETNESPNPAVYLYILEIRSIENSIPLLAGLDVAIFVMDCL